MNIYEKYPDLKTKLNGRIPVILISNITAQQTRYFYVLFNKQLKRYYRQESVVEPVEVNSYFVQNAERFDVVYSMENAESCYNVFRLKDSVNRESKKNIFGYLDYTVYGIDKYGIIRDNNYVPLFKLVDIDEAKCRSVLSYLNWFKPENLDKSAIEFEFPA